MSELSLLAAVFIFSIPCVTISHSQCSGVRLHWSHPAAVHAGTNSYSHCLCHYELHSVSTVLTLLSVHDQLLEVLHDVLHYPDILHIILYHAVMYHVWTHVTSDHSLYSVQHWNSLLDCLATMLSSFGHSLKTFFLSEYYCIECIRGFGDYALYRSMFYLLTYLLTYMSPID